MSRLTKTSLMLAVLFGIDKIFSIIRQIIVARQFGLSSDLDVFNVANNLPDLLFALISGGAIAIAFIPVLTESLSKTDRSTTWVLFSRIANMAFILTVFLCIIVALLADSLVGWELGIAPGFHTSQQELVVELMRLNLIATLIFSISGLVMAGLQANKHFFLPAIAPIFYDFGQITGAMVFAPETGIEIGSITLPAFGLGIHGLVYGVILGAFFHLVIQLPGLFAYKFRWAPSLSIFDPMVLKVYKLLGPRLVTMFIIQLIFIIRDNLASRLEEGAVTALAYGYMIQQIPETLIGTAIGTALLPTLAEFVAKENREAFQSTMEKAMRVLIAATIPIAVLLSLGLRPFLSVALNFGQEGTDLLLWVTRGYMVGLTGHCVLELAARAFYARQNAIPPLIGAVLNVTIYIVLGSILFRRMGAAGISLTDSVAFTFQAAFLVVLLNKKMTTKLFLGKTILRTSLAALLGGACLTLIYSLGINTSSSLVFGTIGMILGGVIVLPFIWPEIKALLRL